MCSGGALAWCTGKQKTVSISTAEAEYVQDSEAVRKIMCITRFGLELDAINKDPLTMFVDNQSVVHMISKDDGKASKSITS